MNTNQRTPRTHRELKAYHADLEATIEREVVEHTGTFNELRRDVATLKQRIRDLAEDGITIEVPSFDDRTMQQWGQAARDQCHVLDI